MVLIILNFVVIMNANSSVPFGICAARVIMHPSSAFDGCTSLTSVDLSGVTSIEEYVAAPSRFPPFSSAPFFQVLLCDCVNSSHDANAFSLFDLHVHQPNVRDKRVVNHIDHSVHPIAIIALRRQSLQSL
jgi:hypothetical protein